MEKEVDDLREKEVKSPSILIIGAGYVGEALGEKLGSKRCALWVRQEASAKDLREKGFEVVAGDVGEEASWSQWGDYAFTTIVHAASSGRGGADQYRRVFLKGLKHRLRFFPAARSFFLSSTSVYGQQDGAVVTEDSDADPLTDTGKVLREAEEMVLAAKGVVLRVSGIYGPDRGILLQRLLRGDAVIEGDGKRWINQIHRDDVVGALLFLIEKGIPGNKYNVVDDASVSLMEFYEWACAWRQLPFPPFVPPRLHRKRGWTHKRVSNAQLKRLGWKLQYPTFREGYPASFA